MLSSTSSSADLASLLPLPSRLSSSSPAGRASPQTFDCWQLASPTQGLPSPLQLDYSDVWSVGHGGDGGGWDGLGGPLSALSAPTYMSHPFNPHSTGSPSSNGAKGVEPNRIFGASSKGGLLNQSKKPRVPVQASQLVASLARRTSSTTTAASASTVAQLDPAFLSNPFFSPFVDSELGTEAIAHSTLDSGREFIGRLPSPAAAVVLSSPGGSVSSSSPLQPPTPPYVQPPTPLLKRHISTRLPVVGSVSQAPAPAAVRTTSATRTILPGDEDRPCSIHSIAGVKRRRLLLAEAAAMASDESDEDEAKAKPPATGQTTKELLTSDSVVTSLPPPFTSTPPSPPASSRGKRCKTPPPKSRPIFIRLRVSQARHVPQSAPDPPANDGAPLAEDCRSEASENDSPRRKRRLQIASSLSSVESLRNPTPPSSSVFRKTRRRCPTKTMPLVSTTQMQRLGARTVAPGDSVTVSSSAPLPLEPADPLSKESSLSPSASSPGPVIFDPGPSDRRSRASSPLSDLSSEPDEIVPLLPHEDEVPLAGPPPAIRSFPADVDLSLVAEYVGWYRRFNVSRTLWPSFADALHLPRPTAPIGSRSSGARFSEPRAQGPADIYAPRWIKGIGIDKMAVCPVCFEDGAGYSWHRTKVSQYNFHMLYAHGVSPTTGLPFSPPLRFRQTDRIQNRPDEKASIREGLCHACGGWVAIEGVKAVEVNVKEIFWWRHAQRCHGSSRLAGDADIWTTSPLLTRLTNYIDSLPEEEKIDWIVPSDHSSFPAGTLD